MPGSRHRPRSHTKVVREIEGTCTTSIEKWKDPQRRNFVVVKFSMIKTLREGESGFQLTGNSTNLGNWRGNLKSIECPENSGHHVVYAALPKNSGISYKWKLLDADRRTIKERESQRSITLGEEDLTVQDCFGVYTSVLPQLFQPDYNAEDQILKPVAFVTTHSIDNNETEAVAVIGSTPELGRWRSVNAKMMYEIEPDTWATIVYLSKGLRFRYKFVVIDKTRSKRIKYGERREHRINLLIGEDRLPTIHEKRDINGIWTKTTQSNISIQHMEVQSMGSVASIVSLGTNESETSYLSDIGEDEIEADISEVIGLEEQNIIIDELKEELHGSIDLIDFHTGLTESQPLLGGHLDSDDEDATPKSTKLEGDDFNASLPTNGQKNNRMCAEWLMKQDNDMAKVNQERSSEDNKEPPSKESVSNDLDKFVSSDLDNLVDPEDIRNTKDNPKVRSAYCPEAPIAGNTHEPPICASLKTSTNQLPGYCTGNLSSFDIARKIARKLPWILDLPTGLVKRVLHSFGILSAEKQAEVSEQLKKPKDELLASTPEERGTKPKQGKIQASSLPFQFK